MSLLNRVSRIGLALVFGLFVGIFGTTALDVAGQGGDPHIDDSLPQPEVFDVSDCATQYQIVDAEESGNNASISETPLVDLKLVGFSISEGAEGTCLVEAVFRAVN